MSLRDGKNKMSKSDESEYSRINIQDSEDEINKKIKKAKTDSLPIPSKVEDLKVTSEELNKRLQQEIQQEIQRQPGKESEIRDTYTRNPQFAAALESGLLEDKVVDFILEGANLKERVVSPDQFMSEEESEKVESTNQLKTVKKKASKKKKLEE